MRVPDIPKRGVVEETGGVQTLPLFGHYRFCTEDCGLCHSVLNVKYTVRVTRCINTSQYDHN